ncbi:CDP-alcohol phosphatidyltransferase family protein [uncultured Marinobacter sp.]|uniref:CDP-alcohol phosphatidyltransferase family protein n=1 Tax=uncultured Marinobacter sp. TaxID=187379 RepID=UPI0026059E3E|nr:CDP-alcohol phosphatidyltransferase family protein [uncultured Marinobacter sp.]
MNKDNNFNTLKEREWSLYSQRGDYFTRWFGLPVSLRITNLYLNLGLNENHASASMFITGLIGAALMILGPWGIFLGASFLVLHHLFDYVDGQIARHHGRASVNGAVLDRWNHFLVESATFPCLAFGLYLDSGQTWPWIAVWILYIWNRFRVLLAQLPANILSEELSRYPALEREMMRMNLSNGREQPANAEPITSDVSNKAIAKPKREIRSYISSMRVASTSYNGFTILLWFGAAVDLVAMHFFSQDGAIEAVIIILTAYAILNILDYSWTYISSDRVALELTARLKSFSK